MPPFHIVDVFAERRYAGNQVAVVEDAGDLTDEEMQRIAAEFDFSETTFVEGRDGDAHRVRIFTPEAEVPFAGHPTLGTAHVLRDGADEVVLDLEVGRVPVEARPLGDREALWMTQRPPTFGDRLPADRLAAVLGLDTAAVDDDWPVQVVSTGLPTVVVPLHGRDALERIEVDRGAYDAVTGGRDAKNVLAFCPEPRDPGNDLAARVFAPFYGVPEDPATGSSNGCLAAWLARHRYLGDGSVSVRVEQGHEMGRPSLLGLDARDEGDAVHVAVGGRVVPVASGDLR